MESGDRIVLENSRLSCSEALGIYYVLAGESSQPQEVRSVSGPSWVCRGFLDSRGPLRFRCEQRTKHFVVEEGSKEG
jgi:hypothetical protein